MSNSLVMMFVWFDFLKVVIENLNDSVRGKFLLQALIYL